MLSAQDKIIERIDSSDFGAFTSADFLDLANFKTINKSLELLEDNKILKRAKRGIYYKPRFNSILGIECTPSLNDIAFAIARQFNWIIIPSGNYALNIIGISTQVPQKIVYISNGPYREYLVGNALIIFKHSTTKNITSYRYNNLIAIQAIKAIGKENLNEDDVRLISHFLNDDDKKEIANGMRITYWIYEVLRGVLCII